MKETRGRSWNSRGGLTQGRGDTGEERTEKKRIGAETGRVQLQVHHVAPLVETLGTSRQGGLPKGQLPPSVVDCVLRLWTCLKGDG